MSHYLLDDIEKLKIPKNVIADALHISQARLSQMLHNKTPMPRVYEVLILDLIRKIILKRSQAEWPKDYVVTKSVH